MPNRIIKESLCTSEKISSLSDFEFRLWVGLITQVDDAGRGDARPAIIKGRVFPLRDRATVKDIDAALHALAAKGCVSLYTVGGKPYFWFPGWADHQRVRDVKPKYPSPDECDTSCIHENTDFDNLPQIAADCGFNPIQSESISESNTKVRTRVSFTPPTIEEVQAYCLERRNNVDPQRFIDYYTANGWLVGGKSKMKDWKAAVRNWEKNDYSQAQKPTKEKAFNTMQQRTDFDFDAIEKAAQRQLYGG